MRILIVDDESDITEILDLLLRSIFPSDTDTTIASSGNEAIKILKMDDKIDICICDHNMPNGMGPDVLNYIVESKSKTKFVLCSTVIPSERPNDYPAEYTFANIQKPDIGHGIEQLFALIKDSSVETEAEFDHREFFPVTVHQLALIEKLPADIYIRMSDNKYIKCINRLDTFTEEDQEKYLQKSIRELYIKKGEFTDTLNEVIVEAVSKIMDRRNISLSEKMSIAHSQLVELIKFTGMTPELAEASKKNIEQSVSLILKSPMISDFWKAMNHLGDYPSRLYTLHSMLASVIVKKLHWYSEAAVYKLTLASFLKGITLDSIPLMEISDHQEFLLNESKFKRSEIKKYFDNPHKSSELVASFKNAPPDVEKILLEQYEMPDGGGIPRKLNANQLSPISCVFIISGIFAHHILREGKSFNLSEFVKYLETRGYSKGNFKDAFDSIKSM